MMCTAVMLHETLPGGQCSAKRANCRYAENSAGESYRSGVLWTEAGPRRSSRDLTGCLITAAFL
jgi:hypothetical protein